jgi:LysR family hydrogen peroxide-inducible transcriptional activator
MTLLQLKYAIALNQYQNYSRAAQVLGISQPGLSLQIKKLEEELNFILFDRSKKIIVPTDKGKVFLDRVHLLLNEAKQLEKLAEQLNQDLSGEISIGIIPTLAPYLLPLFINDFNKKNDRLKVHIKEALTEEIIQDVKSGALDAGIIATPITSKINITELPLFYEGFKLFVSPDHELYSFQNIDVKDIPMNDIWLLKEGNCFRDQVNNICDIAKNKGGQELFYFESNSIESLCRIVEFKGGITFLPELTTLHLSEDRLDLIKELSGKKRVREISLVHLPNHIKKDQLEAFAKIIRSNLPKNLLTNTDSVTIPTNVIV